MAELIRLAVALKYEQENKGAPIVIAAGKGEVAAKMLSIAREENVPIYADEVLAELLSQLEIGAEIPVELYSAVAEVIAFVWGLDKKYAEGTE